MRAKPGEAISFLMTAVESSTTDCIAWPYATNKGYGLVWYDGSMKPAHRIALILASGETGDQAAHDPNDCSTSLCVNPSHLRWATAKENMADKIINGTRQFGERHGRSKLTDEDVRNIRASSSSQRSLAVEYGVDKSTIWNVIHNGWDHLERVPNEL